MLIAASPRRIGETFTTTEDRAMAKAFEGIRVIDFTAVLAGPVATLELALLGADVVKVEQPGVGEQFRGMIRDKGWERHEDLSPAFVGANSGKRAITLDLKHPRAKEILTRLVAGADVVVENFRAGVIDRLGYGYAWAKSVKPDIVFCSISGYGQTGPRAGAPAYDGAIQAASGIMAVTGTPDSGPLRAGFMVVDVSTAFTAAFAISTALYRRLATGEGQYLDVAMNDSAVSLMQAVVSRFHMAGHVPARIGNSSQAKQGTANTWATSDGHIAIAVITDRMVAPLVRALGRPELAADARWNTTAGRVKHHDEIREEIAAIMAEESTETWTQRFAVEQVPISPVNDLATALTDPQFEYRGVMMRLPAPEGVGGEVVAPGVGFIADRDSPGTDRPAPRLGQHTDEVLAELGYSADEIAALHADGAV
jgi:crotonobetainyl-CoA:carnitine CoA-transferase CaiB-like acyl-CoA transferase